MKKIKWQNFTESVFEQMWESLIESYLVKKEDKIQCQNQKAYHDKNVWNSNLF